MTIASRTPEGWPADCPLCGARTNLEFSEPAGDAPCPNCGYLLWRSTELLAHLQRSLARALSIPESEVVAETSFVDDLLADSLDVVELVIQFEDECGIIIPDDDYERIRTVGDAVRYIEEREWGE